jgi:isopenicillin N synthase-like dioxygenase
MGHAVVEDARDAREHFDFGPPEDDMFQNRWPDEAIPAFRPFLEDFFQDCEKVSLEILQALEEAMGVPEATFSQQCVPNASEFRLNHYPAMSVKDLQDEKVERIWPHFDLGVITLLFADSVGGLEFENRQRPGEFIGVEPTSRMDLIVNISETLGLWTAETLPAGLHRVTSPKNVQQDADGDSMIPERYSIAYFCKAARQARVAPLKPFQGDHPVDTSESMTALEYHQKRLVTAY